VGFLEQEVTWQHQRLLQLLAPSSRKEAVLEMLQGLGAQWIDELPGGLDTALGSGDLSFAEARTLKLADMLVSDRRILLLDNLPGAVDGHLCALMASDRERTWIVASSARMEPNVFDQVLELDSGKVVFLGSPTEWLESGRDVRLWGPARR